MTFEIVLLMAVAATALLFFAFDLLPSDVVAIGLLLALVLLGLVPLDEAFVGFGSDTFIVIFGLLVLTAALLRTGVVDFAARVILRHTGTNPTRLLVMIVLASATLGAFMSNTASTAFFVPVVFGLARRAKISPAKLLMPLAFSSIVTSSVSLISTSTNVVVNGLMQQYRLAPMGMFELAPVGIPIAIVGIIYVLTLGRMLIPDRFASGDSSETPLVVRPYMFELVIHPDSPLVGKTLGESGLGRDLDITVMRIVRDKKEFIRPRSNTVLHERDVVIVEGGSDEIVKVKDIPGIDIKPDVKLSDPELTEVELAEVLVLPDSPLVGRTLKGYTFRERFDSQVLGISRFGETFHRKISAIPMKVGDILLVQGRREQIARIEGRGAGRILGMVEGERPKLRHAPVAVAIFLAVIALPTFNILTLPVAVMLGVFGVFVTRCISSDEAYRIIQWKALVLIASMLSLGVAMEHTGTAAYLAGLIVQWVGDADPAWLLTGFFILTVLLTQPMSNQAAAIVVLPVALQTALQLDLNPRTFAMMTAVAASCSYLTPLEPSCLMVYGPGRYKFADFLKVGAILTVLIYLVAIALVPRVWPLR